MMMRARLRIGVNGDRAGPKLLRSGAREVDGGLAIHAGGLRGIRIERGARDNAHAIVLPLGLDHGATPVVSLPSSCRAGEAACLFGGTEQRLGLINALLLLRLRVGVSDNAGAGL